MKQTCKHYLANIQGLLENKLKKNISLVLIFVCLMFSDEVEVPKRWDIGNNDPKQRLWKIIKNKAVFRFKFPYSTNLEVLF